MRAITSQSNSKLKEFTLLCRDRSERDRRNVCVLDGLKLCRDAVRNGVILKQLWLSDSSSEKYSSVLEPVISASEEVFIVTDSAAKKFSETVSPQGVMAMAERPENVSAGRLTETDRVLGLCGVQNPENVGGAIRTAAALGFKNIVVSHDCADPWSPRSVRAGAGTQLNCQILITDDFLTTVKELRRDGFRTIASALHMDSVSVVESKRDGKIFLAVGSEGSGLPEDVINACSEIIHIPLDEGVESLNAAAAAAIMMWELRKQ